VLSGWSLLRGLRLREQMLGRGVLGPLFKRLVDVSLAVLAQCQFLCLNRLDHRVTSALQRCVAMEILLLLGSLVRRGVHALSRHRIASPVGCLLLRNALEAHL